MSGLPLSALAVMTHSCRFIRRFIVSTVRTPSPRCLHSVSAGSDDSETVLTPLQEAVKEQVCVCTCTASREDDVILCMHCIMAGCACLYFCLVCSCGVHVCGYVHIFFFDDPLPLSAYLGWYMVVSIAVLYMCIGPYCLCECITRTGV